MNPYEPPSQATSKCRSSSRYFAMASMFALVGFVVASPGMIFLTSDMNRRMASGRRYATYDQELYLFGISITPGTAQFLAFGVAPFLMALSAFLVFRGKRNQRLNVATDSNTD